MPENTVRIIVSGLVQGVGFRYYIYRQANSLGLTGYVRNLPDGRVEMVCEGSREESARFVEAVCRAMRGYVHEMHTTDIPLSGRYRGFSIKF